MRIDVFFGINQLTPADTQGRVVAVIDVLRASTCIAVALANGARTVIPFDTPDQVVERSLKQAALWDEVKDRLKSSAMALSGGQQQRLCIARTIAPQPEVILLDEPTASLDPQGTQRIEELVFELKKEFTIVIVTHNLQQAARVSDTTTFFYLGSMVESGLTKQIFTRPKHEQTEAYITGRFG